MHILVTRMPPQRGRELGNVVRMMTDVVSSGQLPESSYRVHEQSKFVSLKNVVRIDGPVSARPPHRISLESLTRLDKKVSLLRGHHLFNEDTFAAKIFEVQEGGLFTYYMSAFGYRRIVAFYTAGDVIGIGPAGLHKLACQALSNATVAVFDRTRLIRLARKDSRVSARLWSQMRDDAQQNQDHILWLGSPAQVRLAGFLLSLSRRTRPADRVDLPMNRRALADYLGLTVETLSRCFTQLRKLGVIHFSDFYRLTVMHEAALEREAGLT